MFITRYTILTDWLKLIDLIDLKYSQLKYFSIQLSKFYKNIRSVNLINHSILQKAYIHFLLQQFA